MSKISYCTLEEAFGDSYNKLNNNNNNFNNFKNDNLENNNSEKCDEKYIQLNKTSDSDRLNVIKNMNNVERHQTSERNSLSDNIDEYNRYRFNNNKVDKNDTSKSYNPFNESIEKKYLQDKLNFLENEFKKYKNIFEKSDSYSNSNKIENFSNSNSESNTSNKGNDIIDLILLIIIGLIFIFVMNSIFNIGKSIGSRNKIV